MEDAKEQSQKAQELEELKDEVNTKVDDIAVLQNDYDAALANQNLTEDEVAVYQQSLLNEQNELLEIKTQVLDSLFDELNENGRLKIYEEQTEVLNKLNIYEDSLLDPENEDNV